MPSDAELEAARAVIGKIEIDIRNIFDESDPRENKGLYKLADRLHIRTKPATIRAQLLFKSGDRYSAQSSPKPSAIYESWYSFTTPMSFRSASPSGKVDVQVITRDVWTLDPNISFGRSGGTNSTNINLQEENFLGWGKQLEVGRSSNVDRTSRLAEYSDPNVLGSRWTGALAYVDSSDGNRAHRAALTTLLFARLAVERDDRWRRPTIARFPAISWVILRINSKTTRRRI